MFAYFLATIFVLVVGVHCDDKDVVRRPPSREDLEKVKEAGFSFLDKLTQLEENLFAKGFHVREGSPMSFMAKFKKPSKEVISLSRINMRFVEIVRILKKDFGLTEEQMQGIILDGEFDPGCLPEPECPEPDTYRTIDGSCNHRDQLKNLGRAVSGYRRLLKPAYNDGISSPRSHGIGGQPLKSPRQISLCAFSNSDKPIKQVTSLLMQFGQFINHDMESTSTFTFSNGVGFSCCGANNVPLNPSVLSSLVHCLPINIPVGDPQLQNSNVGCMNFVRSSTGPNRISCNLPFVSYAEQFNQISHWLDASTVYGSDINTMSSLRDPSNGLLQTYTDQNGHDLLPASSCGPSGCIFNAGDSRVNEQPQLTVIHTIWMREHNRIARVLTQLNPQWSRDTVFEETRRIVIAELQHITYNEFLPTLLGVSGMNINKHLWPLSDKKTFHISEYSQESMSVYNDDEPDYYKLETVTSGPVSNEFAAAAFRMGHSLVQGKVQLIDVNGQATFYNMTSVFNHPDLSSDPFFLDNTIRGLVNQNSQTVDNHITDDLWLHLFQTPAVSSGYGGGMINPGILDIVALNIQRGRDHGLPSYNNYREKCGIPKLKDSFGSFPTEKPENIDLNEPIIPYFDPWVVGVMSKVYNSVDDIDLFVGGLAEINPLDDSLLGPTFMCIIADNFLKLKYEDRYFYEAGEGTNPNPFSPEQIVEIKKSSMARIFCDNDDGTVSSIQPNAFFVPSDANPIESCEDNENIPSLNLDLWKV